LIGLKINFIDPDNASVPRFALYQNRPNPFQESTSITFDLPKNMEATLSVFDVSGSLVLEQKGQFSKGFNEIILPKNTLKQSGIYHYQLRTKEQTANRKMLYISRQ